MYLCHCFFVLLASLFLLLVLRCFLLFLCFLCFVVDDDRLEEDEELVEDEKLEELDELEEEEEEEGNDEGSSSGSFGLMLMLVATVLAWFAFSVSLPTGCEMSLTSSSESWYVIEDGGEWNSGKFRCGYRELRSLNSNVVDLAFLVDLGLCFCSHKVSLSSAFLQR